MNFILSALSLWKLIFMMQTNETMGKLIMLIKRCIAASIPFLVFFITWCLIFEILYKALGELSKVEYGVPADTQEWYNDIHPFFGGFFFVFENAVGNIK